MAEHPFLGFANDVKGGPFRAPDSAETSTSVVYLISLYNVRSQLF